MNAVLNFHIDTSKPSPVKAEIRPSNTFTLGSLAAARPIAPEKNPLILSALPSINRFDPSILSQPAAVASFYSQSNGINIKSSDVRSLFKDYKGDDKELVVFILPHDDDAIIGAGLTLVNLIKAGVPVAMLIATDGRSGYSTEKEKSNIVRIREQETLDSAKILGIKTEDGNSSFQKALKKFVAKALPYAARLLPSSLIQRLFDYSHDSLSMVKFLNIADGASTQALGKKFEQQLVTALRKGFKVNGEDRQPTRIIYPTGNDAHLDHQNLAKEVLISVFHATGKIWKDTCGAKSLAAIPEFIEMLVYCKLPGNQTPELLVHGTEADQKTVIDGLNAYVSQLANIPSMVQRVREYPYEFLKRATPPLYSDPDRELYKAAFSQLPLEER